MNKVVTIEEFISESINFDKEYDQILIKIDDLDMDICNFEDLIYTLGNIEIGLLFDKIEPGRNIVNLCKLHKIIVYIVFKTYIRINIFEEHDLLDKVLIVDQSDINILTDEKINDIVKYDYNVCVNTFEYSCNEISDLFEKLIRLGFSKIFKIVNMTSYNTKTISYNGLINRKTLQNNNYHTNLIVKDQIDALRLNMLKRRNKTKKLIGINYNIAFINLNIDSHKMRDYKNLGIEYLASVLNSQGFSSSCFYFSRASYIREVDDIINENNIKVIGFSCTIDNINVVKNAIKYTKSKYKMIKFIIGGAQAIALDKEFLTDLFVDYVMVGESENQIVALANHIFYNNVNIENIHGLRYIDSKGDYRQNNSTNLINDLDSIPFPDYVFKEDENLKRAGILTGRGCPYKCAFCYEGAKEKTVRYRSLDNVFEEISILIKNHKSLELIHLYDDTFTLDSERVVEFCNRFKSIFQKYNIYWVCEIHCQTVYNKPELLKLMVSSGLKSAQIGIESVNNSVLKKLNKNITTDMIFSTINNCLEAEMYSLEGNIIIGATSIDDEQFIELHNMIEKMIKIGKGLLNLNVVIFWPCPNTPISLDPEVYGINILNEQCEYSIHGMFNVVTKPIGHDREILVKQYYSLTKKIRNVYLELAKTIDSTEALRHFNADAISKSSTWRAYLSSYSYINTFIDNKKAHMIEIFSDNVYPIRTFDLLAYKGNRLYIKEANMIMNILDTQILELCNGKNTSEGISEKLKVDIKKLKKHLIFLESKMLVYGSII
jgi:radical SAM superfamily enzyme YgiQ (UPF0313 family)